MSAGTPVRRPLAKPRSKPGTSRAENLVVATPAPHFEPVIAQWRPTKRPLMKAPPIKPQLNRSCPIFDPKHKGGLWERSLWKRNVGLPDNYVPSSFLSSLLDSGAPRSGRDEKGLEAAVLGTLNISLHLSLMAIFGVASACCHEDVEINSNRGRAAVAAVATLGFLAVASLFYGPPSLLARPLALFTWGALVSARLFEGTLPDQALPVHPGEPGSACSAATVALALLYIASVDHGAVAHALTLSPAAACRGSLHQSGSTGAAFSSFAGDSRIGGGALATLSFHAGMGAALTLTTELATGGRQAAGLLALAFVLVAAAPLCSTLLAQISRGAFVALSTATIAAATSLLWVAESSGGGVSLESAGPLVKAFTTTVLLVSFGAPCLFTWATRFKTKRHGPWEIAVVEQGGESNLDR